MCSARGTGIALSSHCSRELACQQLQLADDADGALGSAFAAQYGKARNHWYSPPSTLEP